MKRTTPILLTALTALALPLVGQQTESTEERPAEQFFERVEVNVVNVDVYVTDEDGNPVTGLGPEDFRVREDGRPVEITNFLEVMEGTPVERRPTVADLEELDAAPAEVAPQPIAPTPPASAAPEPLYLAIYIDNFNLSPSNRRWALEAIQRFLVTKIRPGDRVMLASYDRGLHVRQPFTDDTLLVTDALDEVLKLVANRSTRDAERRQVLEEIFAAQSQGAAAAAAHRHAEYVRHEMEFALNSLGDVIRSLSGIQGRKALLYISDGIPDVVDEDLFVAIEQRFKGAAGRLQAFSYDLHDRYRRLTTLANSSGVTLYTLDAKGQALDPSASAEYSGKLQHAARANIGMIDVIRQQNLAAPLLNLADETGGQAILRTNALDRALADVARDFRTYYSLGYRRSPTGTERYHRIEVEVTSREDVRVRHREGYREKTPTTLLREGTIASLQHGFENNPLGVDLAFQSPTPQEDDRFNLPLEVRIPLGDLTLIPFGEAHRGEVQVAVAVQDEEGRMTPVLIREPFEISVPAADLPTALGQHVTYSLELLVRGGRQQVAVSVRDLFADRTSYVREPVAIR